MTGAGAGAVVGMLRQYREVFTDPGNSYQLGTPPVGFTQVFLNGILLAEGEDYMIVAKSLDLTTWEVRDSDILQVYYWGVA